MLARRFWTSVAALWLVATLVILVMRAHAIASHAFLDVDDELRLVEVRDWIAGQSFTDVTQYHMNAPFGAPMHWSRLVDMPLALLILLLRPLLGYAGAETVAAVVVPLLTLGVIMAAVAATGRRLAGPLHGLLAATFSAMCVPTLFQIFPLRVDHHGWETALQLIGLLGILDRQPRRGARVAGVALAFALQISLEPLAFTGLVGLLLGCAWLVAPTRDSRDRLRDFMTTLAAIEMPLFALLHAPSVWSTGYCDAVSPPHLLLLGLSAAGIALVTWINPRTRLWRLLALGAVAVGAAAAYRAYPPHCGLDAFSSLEPIVRTLWYEHVMEGLPFWKLSPDIAATTILFPLVGTACAVYASRSQGTTAARTQWTLYAAQLAAATMVGLLVQRANGFSWVAATPAVAWVAIRIARRTLASLSPVVRVLGTAMAGYAFSPLGALTLAVIAVPGPATPATPGADVPGCTANRNIIDLSALPPSRLLTPLDLGPSIVYWTQQMPLASGHHRNHVAMAQTLTAFMGSDAVAHAIVRARGINYVVFCAGTNDMRLYGRTAPAGFAAALARGHAPAWLAPAPLPGNPIRIYRVLN